MKRFLLGSLLSCVALLSSSSALAQAHHHGASRYVETPAERAARHAARAARHAERARLRAEHASRHAEHASRHAAQPAHAARPAHAAAAPGPVPQDVADVVGALERLRVYAMRAPAGAAALGAHGAGAQYWFLLPGCQAPDACPVDRVEVEAVGGTGSVRPGAETTLMTGSSVRQVRAVAIGGAPFVRVQLFAPSGELRYETVVDAARFVELPPAAGRMTPQGFAIDLARYPGR